ncbi:MAG: hypothetical protein ACJ73N_14210 [Bryobacteraceae bacterium]
MEANKRKKETSKKMYLTAAEAEALNLPSVQEQIERWNKLQAEIRAGRK